MKRILALSLAAFLALSCDKPSPPPAPPSTAVVPETPPGAPGDPGSRSPWPPPPDKGEEVDLTENILARNYYVVLDGSGSMREQKCSGSVNKSSASKAALKKFADTVPADANLGLLAFDYAGVSERSPLGMKNRKTFFASLEAVRADKNTPLRNAVALGLKALERQARRQLGYGEYHLVVVTDGEADKGQRPDQVVDYIVDRTPIIIHTIGFCIGEEHSLNQPGRTIYKAADNPAELGKGLQEVLAEAETFVLDRFE
jgi:Ca-activated chloride channel family protein